MALWTNEQQKAISERKTNLLVSAAAGSGKTAVLIERVICLVLEDRIDIDRLLIVTFTRAAAAEMRERTANALMERLAKTPDQDLFIRKQMANLNQASMMTFHSFCIKVIRNHYFLTNLDPDFRTADQAEMLVLQQESIDEVLEKAYEESNPSFLELVEMYCQNKSDDGIQAMVKGLYDFSRSHPNPHQWLEDQTKMFSIDSSELAGSGWMSTLMNLAAIRLAYIKDLLDQSIAVSNNSQGPEAYLPRLREERDSFDRMKEMANDHDMELVEEIRHFCFRRLPACRGVDPQLRDEAKSFRDQAKKEVKYLQEHWFNRSLDSFVQDHQTIAPALLQLIQVVNDFETIYQEKKKERNVLDFSDLEHRALEILTFPEAQNYYQKHYEAIFIDEYQDSNRVQETLIDRIKRPDNVFMVGDVKQSIYRFRLAEPELFMEKYHRFRASETTLEARIDLNRNFRSHPKILEAVNTVFSQIMSETLGEIQYNDDASLQPGMVDENESLVNPVIVHLLETRKPKLLKEQEGIKNKDEVDRLLEDWTNQEAEARLLTQQIRELMKSKITDSHTGALRDVQYRDITILLRAPGNQAPQFMDVFCREGIPVYADLGTGFFDSLEINLFTNLLRIIDNLRQDMPLLSILKSPFGHFTVEELAEIRLGSPKTSYVDAVLHAGKLETVLGKKVNQFFSRLDEWRYHQGKKSLHDYLWWLLLETGFYAVCAAMPGGQQRQANLRIFMKRAAEFGNTNGGSLFEFLNYVDRLKFSRGSDSGPARTLSESDDVIRMMSIHKSKGLEFPMVIVAGLGKQFNKREMQMPLLMHRSLGLGPLFVNPVLRIKRNTLARVAIREKMLLENLSEEMRILYVAMTRAKDKLILMGTINNLTDKIRQWNEPCSLGSQLKAKSVLDWMGPVWVRLPEGEELKQIGEASGSEPALIKHESNWAFRVWDLQDILLQEKEKDKQVKQFEKYLNRANDNEEKIQTSLFHQRFQWEYPYLKETVLAGKVSVSELLKQSSEADQTTMDWNVPQILTRPRFVESEKGLTSAEKGTALHYFMQHIDLKKTDSIIEVREQIVSMVNDEMLTLQEGEIIDPEAVMRFLKSDIGQRMISSDRIHRELPFVIRQKNMKSVLVQGVIDCCFIESGSWVLVDYKSDVVAEEEIDHWVNRYTPQITLYQEALEELSGIYVKEAVLYSFHLHKTVKVNNEQISRKKG